MTLQVDRDIRNQAEFHGLISDFVDHQVKEVDGKKIVSYGLSSCGYDARLAGDFMLASSSQYACIDPLQTAWQSELIDINNVPAIVIPPRGFALGRTVERFALPADMFAICVGKSTYARCGLIVNVTPLEPGWEGHVTLELHNATTLPIRVHANQGICQFIFFRTHEKPAVSYADRGGKYQDQSGITLPKV